MLFHTALICITTNNKRQIVLKNSASRSLETGNVILHKHTPERVLGSFGKKSIAIGPMALLSGLLSAASLVPESPS